MRSHRVSPTFTEVRVPVPQVDQSPDTITSSSRRQWLRAGFWSALQLCLLGMVLEAGYLAFYPLLLQTKVPAAPEIQRVFPWLSVLSWTSWPLPAMLLRRVSWLDPVRNGSDTLFFLLLLLLMVLVLLAARSARVALRKRLSRGSERWLYGLILLGAGVFALTLLPMPAGNAVMSHDLLLYGLYGRMVVFYHVNPYVTNPAFFPHDLLQRIVNADAPATYGAFWMDTSLLLALLGGQSIARLLLVARLLGLIFHLSNTVLIWTILNGMKSERRLVATLFYAWNPLVLLFSVPQMHMEVVLVFFLLLAFLFWQRNAPTLGWVFVVLATLTNLLCLLLWPFFLLLMGRGMYILTPVKRLLWWINMAIITLLMIVLAYAPYWNGWGLVGMRAHLLSVFWPASAVNSLDAALLHLPLHLPVWLQWPLAPHHWAAGVLLIVACCVLLGLWLIDSLKLALLFTGWIMLLVVLFFPVYWPWYVLPALALVLLSTHEKTTRLAIFLLLGACASYFCWLWPDVWPGQGLVAVGIPLVVWGWLLFFASTWQMVRAQTVVAEEPRRGLARLSRPPWLSRPSRPGRVRL